MRPVLRAIALVLWLLVRCSGPPLTISVLTARAYTSLCDATLRNNESLRDNASTPLRMQHTASGAPGDTLALSDFRAQAWKLWSADGAFNALKARLHMCEQGYTRASKAAFPLARPRTR